ncbi:fructose-1,6-bisphosphatase [Fulvivirga lutimaris]|uniref:fructose-1,6-bisphosphatase n=1 Tax=Fulvivirga lutimaris TaxID=1819566 RepID=UPI0012BD2338|nr:fructose-1,6-bisphosphatase [Fulvivirga lutimaris]MTI40095.1 fructose-1,6-bisphosphatase [Fulvivirga lutimaris]
MTPDRLKYLKQLAQKFPTRSELGKEIMLLESVLSQPKGSELFISDVHGEYDSFQHMIRNGSGMIRQRLVKIFGESKSETELKSLASLIYYPEEKLKVLNLNKESVKSTLQDLSLLAKDFSSIYANRKLARLINSAYKAIILSLVCADYSNKDKRIYNNQLIDTIIDIEESEAIIIEICRFIQRLSIHSIHIIGDIYNRGPAAENILDDLLEYDSVDVQWGNHDIVWMGAACGSLACIANVIRLSLRYGNTSTLEKGYGINLIPLASFALEHYKEEESIHFDPKVDPEELINTSEKLLNRMMHKAISVIQFKLEDQLKMRQPGFNMNDQLIWENIDFKTFQIELEGKKYELHDKLLPTVDPNAPHELSSEEQDLMNVLELAFKESDRLQRHVKFLIGKGGMYKVTNNCLLYHGCIPLNEQGDLKEVDLLGQKLKGKALLDFLDAKVREAYFMESTDKEKQLAVDIIWYLWCGPDSPLFGKSKMTTFERYFITDTETHKENKSYYYQYRNDESTCDKILNDFGLTDENAIIINGHVPVVAKGGENPVKANGKLYVIDGGFSKAYQSKTGIAGYTLIFDQKGKQLISHMAFESKQKAIDEEIDIQSYETLYSPSSKVIRVKDIDDGPSLMEYIVDLKELMINYKRGKISGTKL